MEFLAEGFRALERHWRIVAAYTLSSLAVIMAIHTWQAAMLQEWFGPVADSTVRIGDLIVMVGGTALIAAIQAIFLARFGQAIDRPLFKLDGTMDAIRRFFTLWLLLNIVMLALNEFTSNLAVEKHPAAEGVLIFVFIWHVIYIPIGACIMFHGTSRGSEIAEALAPMGRLFPQTLSIFVLRMFEFSLLFAFAGAVVPTAENGVAWLVGAPALSTMAILLECVSFAAMWEICRVFRDLDDQDDEFDF